MKKKPMVFLSKHAWEPGIKGSLINFSIGDKAIYRTKTGKTFPIRIESDLMSHNDAGDKLVRECHFFDSPEGPCKVAVDADQIEPII